MRPEWVTCVKKSDPFKTWCGKNRLYTFLFTSWEHAFRNEVNGGYLMFCSRCYQALIRERAGAKESGENGDNTGSQTTFKGQL